MRGERVREIVGLGRGAAARPPVALQHARAVKVVRVVVRVVVHGVVGARAQLRQGLAPALVHRQRAGGQPEGARAAFIAAAREEVRGHGALALDLHLPAVLEVVVRLGRLHEGRCHLDLPRVARALHAARHVDRVPPDVVEELGAPHHARHHGPAVEAHPHVEHAAARGAGSVPLLEALVHVQREGRQHARVVIALVRQTRHNHVAVPDGLDLLQPVLLHQDVEHLEDVVEQGHHLLRGHLRRHLREPHHVREEDGRAVEAV
mmetsp:Transcript_18260/g.59064  ORF Transcript_18260/g.59064 Transcript_18260/m.59064 type:complete len:262 (-) Transcript_18260:607-1392(-)